MAQVRGRTIEDELARLSWSDSEGPETYFPGYFKQRRFGAVGTRIVLLTTPQELVVPPCKPCRIGLQPCAARHMNARVVNLLQPVLQYRSILLLENVPSNFDRVVRPNAVEHPVVAGVMQFAKR